MRMTAAAMVVLTALGVAASAVPGCSKSAPAHHDPALARVYADLMLLHEEDKTMRQMPDSLYRIHADSVLQAHGLTEESYRQKSEALAQNDETWRLFLADVSTTFDSLKAYRLQHPR